MASYSTWIMSIKAVFISTGVAAMALFLKISVPLAVDFSVSRAPILWSSLISLMKPPYLYVVINGIIITIAASSRFRQSSGHRDDGEDDDINISGDGKIQTQQIFRQAPPRKPVAIAVDPVVDFGYESVSRPPRPAIVEESSSSATVMNDDADDDDDDDDDDDEKEQAEEMAAEVEATVAEEDVEEKEKRVVVVESPGLVGDGGDEFEVESSNRNHPLERTDSSEVTPEYLSPVEKPLVSARFGHRKSIKASTEGGGRALRVARPKRHETLENTWKMITEGKSMPLTRHLKKSDTWQNHGRHLNVEDASSAFKKSETFRDRTNNQSPSTGKLRKDPSLSQDELNRRVEAFIKKFNEEMRLQRLESLKQYQEMISRGV